MNKENDLSGLQKLADEKLPIELLKAGPKRYANLDTAKEGSWRTVSDGGVDVAVVWTDWDDAFGAVALRPGDVFDRLDSYVVSSRALDIPAGWAYTTLETFVKRIDSELELSPQKDGKLSSVLTGKDEESDTEELED